MALTLQLPNIRHQLVAFFRQFMSQPPPTDVEGLFIPGEFLIDTSGWNRILGGSASSCKLERIVFCKTQKDKRHEFLVLYFSHHTHTSAHAAVIVDRAAKDPSQSSAIVSPRLPSQMATPASDRVHVVAQGVSIDAYLSSTYGAYHKLCILEYPRSDLDSSTHQPPSAIQLSTLLLVVTKHQPDYNLYEHNCYWFADMVFEASKDLFLGLQEQCHKHDERGRCRLGLPMLATHSLPSICEEYRKESLQIRRVERDVVDRQELEQKLAEEQRGREAAESRCAQLLAERSALSAELQSVRQAQLCTSVN